MRGTGLVGSLVWCPNVEDTMEGNLVRGQDK